MNPHSRLNPLSRWLHTPISPARLHRASGWIDRHGARIALFAALAWSAAVIVPFLFAAILARPQADDYILAATARDKGQVGALKEWYFGWHGRFTFQIATNIFAIGAHNYSPLVALLLFAGFLAGWSLALRPYSALAPVLLAALLVLSPAAPESTLWAASSLSCFAPLGATGFLVWSVRQNKAWVALALAFFIAGCSETFACASLAVLLACAFQMRSRAACAALFGMGVGLIVVVAAPGNGIRRSFYPPTPALMEGLRIANKAMSRFLFLYPTEWLIVLFFLAALLTRPSRKANWRGCVLGCACVLGVFFCFLPAAFGTSHAPPSRTLMVPTFFCLAATGFFALSLPPLKLQADRMAAVGAVLWGLYSAWPQSRAAIESLRPAHEYSIAWQKREAQLRRGETVVEALPPLWHIAEPTGDPTFWVNQGMKNYYVLPRVIAR